MKTYNRLFPPIEPYQTGFLRVSNEHNLYYEQSGNPNGAPVVYLHGGPGCGTSPTCRQYFDPEHYRIILFDQRGSGKSTPLACLKDNDTHHLIDDMEKIRELLHIDRWLVFGGSWGSTLALYYAIAHPNRVKGLILRGIFLGRKEDVDWLYQFGCSEIFPEAWEEFIRPIPKAERGDLVQAYYKRLTSKDEAVRLEAAKAWSRWEGSVITLLPSNDTLASFSEDHYALSMATIECHYFVNRMFNDYENHIIEHVANIQNIPTTIIHGRYDMDCRMRGAYMLHKAMKNAKLIVVDDAGHSSSEPGILHELIEATEDMKRL